MSMPKCCCGCCTLPMGVTIIAVVWGVLSTINFIFGIIAVATLALGGSSYVSIVLGALSIITNILLFIGIRKEERTLFLPWLVLEVINIIALFALAILAFVGSAYVGEATSDASAESFGMAVFIVLGVIYLLFMILEIYIWSQVLRLFLWMGKNPGAMNQNNY